MRILLILCEIFLIIAITNVILSKASRTFEIDYENNVFLKDGQPFRYISGSMHYFRVPSIHWTDRFTKMKACGLNAVQTYIEWSSHEPEFGTYDFNGNNDFVQFIRLAQESGLLVILRLGPFIASERDNMGLPYWLASKYPNITYRTSDQNYLNFVNKWYSVLLPLIKPLLYENGGPIIAAQIENEYGSYYACDYSYTTHLRDLVRSYLGPNIVLFTVDGSSSSYLKCGIIDNVYPTVDFGPGLDPIQQFKSERLFAESGPLVNSEFYPGWFDVWGEPHSTVSSSFVCSSLDQILATNASVNIYMFHGGTSFGFTAGATTTPYGPMPTSYDYDAPINDCGDLTPKYFDIKNVIQKYVSIPDLKVSPKSPKMELNPITVYYMNNIFDMLEKPIYSEQPLSFEEIHLRHGFVYYSTNISFDAADPSLLNIENGVFDRAMVFVNKVFKGVLSRMRSINQMPIYIEKGSELGILVENQGHACCSKIAERKGILGKVWLGSKSVEGWNMFRLFTDWEKTINGVENGFADHILTLRRIKSEVKPSFYSATFVLPNDASLPLDTFFLLENGRKGIAFLNGFNLGRYWTSMGPQITLYAPKSLFNAFPNKNVITVLELETPINMTLTVKFTKQHVINGKTPDNLINHNFNNKFKNIS